jgi:hypothetical protein
MKEVYLMKRSKGIQLFELLALGFLILLLVQACQKGEKTETPTAETAQAAAVPAPDVFSILGRAEAQNSGVFDMNRTTEETLITYHFYATDLSNFEKDFGQALAPQLRELYKQLKDIDMVVFDVYVPSEGTEPWRPYVHFSVSRKIIEETDWTKLLDVDFFQVVQDLKYSD